MAYQTTNVPSHWQRDDQTDAIQSDSLARQAVCGIRVSGILQ